MSGMSLSVRLLEAAVRISADVEMFTCNVHHSWRSRRFSWAKTMQLCKPLILATLHFSGLNNCKYSALIIYWMPFLTSGRLLVMAFSQQ